jgi:hypothetical protein
MARSEKQLAYNRAYMKKYNRDHPVRRWWNRYNNFLRNHDKWPDAKTTKQCHELTCTAMTLGIIARPKVCWHCCRECKPDAHHENYTAPLEITWLCRTPCHIEAEKLRYERLGLKRRYRGRVDVPAWKHKRALALWKTRKLSQVKIGRRLGISNSTVSKICSGKTQPRY